MKNIRKFFSLLIIISVIISSCLIVHSASVNFALGAEVIKSGAGSQAKVNDGIKPSNNSNSAYINSINGSNYIGFDLGEEKTIESIIIYEATSATRHIGNFVIETSSNSSFANAVKVAEGTGLATDGKTVTFPSPVNAQYIRFRPTSYKGTDTSGMVYISEIEIMGSQGGTTPPPPPQPPTPELPTNTPNDSLNLALSSTFTSGGGASSSNLARLKDGTKYISSNSNAYNFGSNSERFLVCDLGSIKYINQVSIYEYSKSLNLESYELLYSTDGTNYVSLVSVNGAGTNGGLATHQFDKVAARYIKLLQKAAAGNVYLAEIEVYYKNNVVLPEGSKNLINSQNIASSTSPVITDGNLSTAYKNILPSDTLNLEITLKGAENLKALAVYFENGENIGNISVYAGDSASSSTLVYTDNLGADVKIIPITSLATKYIKISLSQISGQAGISEVEGFSDNSIIKDYIHNFKETVSSYIINQAKYSNTVNLPQINSSTWSINNPSVANILGSTLNITGEDTSFLLTGNLDLGGNVTLKVDISITVGETLDITPVIPEINDSILIAGANVNPFYDIDGSWAYDYIVNLNKLKIISGVTKTTFEPEREITRAEFVKLLVESLMIYDSNAKSAFSDVSVSNWYYPFIASLESTGINLNLWEDKFYPEAYITREDMAYFTLNALKSKNISLNLSHSLAFSDFNDISEYARESVNLLTQTGFISGNPDGTFKPKGNLTRAEASKIIYLVYNCY